MSCDVSKSATEAKLRCHPGEGIVVLSGLSKT